MRKIVAVAAMPLILMSTSAYAQDEEEEASGA